MIRLKFVKKTDVSLNSEQNFKKFVVEYWSL